MLGGRDVTVLASASMGPAYSLAVTTGPMVARAGGLAPLALALLVVLMLGVALGFARLTRARPDAGSSYGWARAAFGPHVGAYAAWLLLLSNVFAVMATALPAGTGTLALVAPRLAASTPASAGVGALWIAVSAALLAAGLRPTALVSLLFLATELAVVLASAVAVALGPAALAAPPVAIAPPAHVGLAPLAGLGGAAALGIWMTDGWEVSAAASEETTGPRTAGRGGVVGLLATSAILLAVMVAYLRLGPAALAAHPDDTLAYVGTRLGGAWPVALAATVLVSTAATLWTTLLYLSRSLFAMGRTGVVPRGFGALDARGAPAPANLAVALGTGAATLATGLSPELGRALAFVIDGTSLFLGALFVLSVAAGARLALGAERRATLVPLICGAGLLAIVVLALATGDPVTREVELAGLALGVPFAWWRGRRRGNAVA